MARYLSRRPLGDRSASPPVLPFVSVAGVLVAIAVFVLVGLVAPDDGATVTSLRQGFALAAVFAAVPIATLAHDVDATSLVSLGGGMVVAGVATTPGGNLLGLVMAACGLSFFLVGGSRQPSLTIGVVGRLLVYAVLLASGVWLASGVTMVTGLAALLLALIVSTGPRW